MRNILVFISLLVLCLTGCSANATKEIDVLAAVADADFQQSFHLDEEKSITLTVEIYEYGKRQPEPLLYFGNTFEGEGTIRYAYFRADESKNSTQLIESFETAVIGNSEKAISRKIIHTSPYLGFLFDPAKPATLTKPGTYVIGAYGFLSDEQASTGSRKIPVLHIQQPQETIDAYKEFPLVYLIIAEIL